MFIDIYLRNPFFLWFVLTGWDDYKKGFGDLKGEFWLGLDNIHRLTQQVKSHLRVDIADANGNTACADYSNFTVANERAKYKLGIGTYSGTY